MQINTGFYTRMQKERTRTDEKKASVFGQHLTQEQQWILGTHKQKSNNCHLPLVCVPPLVFSPSEVYSTYTARSINTHKSIFLCFSVSAAQHRDPESLCSQISLSMHQNAMLQLYMLLHGKRFNNCAVCWCCLNNQSSTCTIGAGFEFGVWELENTTEVNCYSDRISIQQFRSEPQETCGS